MRFIGLVLFVLSVNAFAAGPVVNIGAGETLRIDCTPPETRENGQPLAPDEISGYRVYYGTSPKEYTEMIPISQCGVEITPTLTGQNYLALTAIDTEGRESAFSNEVPFEVIDNPSLPAAPTVIITVVPFSGLQ